MFVLLNAGRLIFGTSKLFADFGSPIGVKELFESPTYRWQKYDVVTTYYWNKYETSKKYGLPLLTDGNPVNRQVSHVSSQIIEGEDEATGLSWSVAIYQPITSVTVDPDTGKISGNPDYSKRFYSASYYAPSEYKNRASYNDTCYYYGGNIWYIASSVYAKSHSWAGIDLTYHNTEQVTGPTISYMKGYLIESNITSTVVSTYPADGKHTDNYWYIKQSKEDHAKGNNLLGTVTSKIETAYPENGYLSGYWYIRTA